MAAEKINFHDLYQTVGKAVSRNFKKFIIKKDQHPNETAHKLIAESLWPWLEPRLKSLQTGKSH
jgi:lysophospholipase L1-like esterase